MMLKPISTEKAVKMIDVDNTLVFETVRNARKDHIKKEIENLFDVKVQKIRTHVRANKKFVYVRLVAANPASDVATKLGMI